MKTHKAAFFLLMVAAAAAVLSGCNKTGQLDNPLEADPEAFIRPTIYELKALPSSLCRDDGGIMTISCGWQSPRPVNAATATLCFVKTIKDTISEPIGVIASETDGLKKALATAATTATASGTASASESAEIAEKEKEKLELAANKEFYERFKEPIEIPTTIGTNEQSGLWRAEIPFTKNDLKGAPLGIVQQMTLYMTINKAKTNTLSFEISFTTNKKAKTKK